MTTEDYMHYGWHKLHVWNKAVFAEAKQKAEKEFDALLNERENNRRKKMSRMQPGDLQVWDK